MEQSFIFHDPTGKRWSRFRRLAQIGIVLGIVAAVLVGLSVLTSPQLPALGLGSIAHVGNLAEVKGIIGHEKARVNLPYALKREKEKMKLVRGATPVVHQKFAARIRDDQPLVFGYYVNWDEASAVSLRLNLNRLTHLVPEWLTLANGKGDITDESDPTIIRIAADANLPILAMLTNFRKGWQAGDLHSAITDPGHRTDLINNIYSNLVEHKFAGVNIDLEDLPAHDREAMVEFMTQLRAKLAPAGFLADRGRSHRRQRLRPEAAGRVERLHRADGLRRALPVGRARSGGEYRLVRRPTRPAVEDAACRTRP